uniref:UDP-glucuronate decarboxylase 1 n=1 Tax=Sus scrofa TaxID=9823 RepID=A0A8D0REI6_PIG
MRTGPTGRKRAWGGASGPPPPPPRTEPSGRSARPGMLSQALLRLASAVSRRRMKLLLGIALLAYVASVWGNLVNMRSLQENGDLRIESKIEEIVEPLREKIRDLEKRLPVGGSRAFPMGWPRTGLEESARTPKMWVSQHLGRIAEGLGAQTHRSLGSVTLALGTNSGKHRLRRTRRAWSPGSPTPRALCP